MVKRALTVARFQPFHMSHYKVVQMMKKGGYEEIILGIGSAEQSEKPDNPFTCRERIEMIHSVLRDESFKHYFLIPIRDINDYDLWVHHVVRLTPEFEVVYAGNPLIVRLFKNAGYRVVETERMILTDFKKNPIETIEVTGSRIREMIINDDKRWEKLVPEQVYKKILEFNGVKRIKELYGALYNNDSII